MSKNLTIILFATAVLIFLFGIIFFTGNESSATISTSGNSPGSNPGIINNSVSEKITREILSKHNTESDCWISYNGKVYDITSWLQKHPGGIQAILPYCGTAEEFQKAFEAKHGKTKVSLLMQVGIFTGDFEQEGEMQ